MKATLILGTMAVALNASAVLFTSTPNSIVPDGDTNGWANSINVTGQTGTITPGSLQVKLDLAGGWNGDLYAYLVHGTGFAVLLDRVGQGTPGEPTFTYGFGTAGMNVWLSDATGDSIDTTAIPGFLGTTYSRNGYAGNLASFDNLNPNGTWTLFVADLSASGVTTVQSWGLQMDIVAVPEVETWIAAALAGAFGAFWVNRQIWKGVKQG
jgi:subtilisin-like proprotein convertase family protein